MLYLPCITAASSFARLSFATSIFGVRPPAADVTERTYLGAKATMLSDIRMFVALTAETAFTSGYGGEPPTRRRSAATSGEGISHRAALMCS